MVGRNPEVSCALLDHGQHRGQNAADRADFLTIRIFRRGHGEKMPEQFIGAVD